MDRLFNWTKSVSLTVMIAYLLTNIALGGELPGSLVLRPVFGFILLTAVPGYLLVALLRVDDQPTGRTAIYAVGLSLAIVTVFSLILNTALPLLGFDRPLTSRNLTAAVSVLVLGLSTARYSSSGSTSPLQSLSLSGRDWIAIVGLSLLPVYSVLVTILTNGGSNGLLIVLLCLLSIVPVLLWWWEESSALAPYAIWAVSASVLFQMTLVSGHLWGFDIHFEYFTATDILNNEYWNPGRRSPSNSLATVTLLAAVYSKVTGLDLVWIYKAVYPLLVSLLPLGIWYIVRSTFEDRSIATLAPFALVFYYGFFKDMPDKQLVAGLFAVFLLVVFLDDGLSDMQQWVIGIPFAVALTFSHYGVSLLFAAFLGGTFVARHGLQVLTQTDIDGRISRPGLIAFLGGFWIVWYLFSSSGVNFYRVVGVGYEIVASLPFPTTERSGAAYATTGFTSIYWILYKFLYFALVGLIGVGMISALYSTVTSSDDARSVEYSLFSAGVFAFLVASVVFTFGMGFDRTLQIALFVVSPFALVGSRTVVSIVSQLAGFLPQRDLRSRIDAIPIDGLFAVFLAVLFLFSSGTVFALAGQQVPPYNINVDEDAGWPVYSQSEVEATRWLASHANNESVAVYNEWSHIKSRDGLLVSEVLPADELEPIWLKRTSLNHSAYVYVSKKPMRKLNSDSEYIDVQKTPFYTETLSTAEVVYSNEQVTIYYVSR